MGTVIRALAGGLVSAALLASCTSGSPPGAPTVAGGGDAVAGPGAALAAVPAVAAAPAAAADGKALYAANCAVCHGAEGKGDGTAAYLLWPRPRDFTRGQFKIRSTPSGALPTDDDLYAVITHGMPGSSMPAWPQLTEAERRALVGQVKALSQFLDEDEGKMFNHFQAKPPPPPVTVPSETPVGPESVARGRALYLKLDCVKCHGDGGRGDGVVAMEQVDDCGDPIRPNDYTRGVFKGGSTGRDLYLRIINGIGGTPMPQFGPEHLTDAERWDVVHYIQSLSEHPATITPPALPGSALRAARVKTGGLPRDPADPAWDQVPPAEIPLNLLFYRPAPPVQLSVQAAHDGKRIALLLAWGDAAVNDATLRPQDFRDAVALQFALKGMDTPFTMGAPDKPVNLWHWKADWQKDLGSWQDVEQIYPGMAVEMYPFQKGDPTNDRGSRPAAMPSHDPAFISARAAGNRFADPNRRSPVEDLTAAGFGTLTSLPAAEQSVEGRGIWIGGRWVVQITRTFTPPDPCCVTFAPGKEVPVSFAVWDGGAGDRNGQKAVTTWYRLVLEK